MNLDESIYDRVVFAGGKAAGVDCPECQFESRDVELNEYSIDAVSCPDCGATILSEEEKSQLRRSHKL